MRRNTYERNHRMTVYVDAADYLRGGYAYENHRAFIKKKALLWV